MTISRNGVSVSKSAPATNGAGQVTDHRHRRNLGSGRDGHDRGDRRGRSRQHVFHAIDDRHEGHGRAERADGDLRGSRRPERPINGTCEANATITATRTVPSAAGPYTATASSTGTYTVTVARVDGQTWNPITVTYLVTATDRAGNTSAATTLTYNVTR